MKSDDREGWRFETDAGPRRARSFFIRHPALALLLVGVPIAFVYSLYEADKLWSSESEILTTPLQLTLFWSLWLALPVAVLALLRVFLRARRGNILAALVSAGAFLLASLVIWAHVGEPNRVRVVETKLDDTCGVKVALVSDLHIGLFSRDWQLERWVRQLNALDVDAVLVAGDWTLTPPYDLKKAFAPWTKLRHRSIGVLGTQEERKNGPRLADPLRETLRASGVEWIDGQRTMLGRCELVGLGDLRSGTAAQDLRLVQGQRSTMPGARRLVLAHHPDTADLLPANWAAWLLAGETHGAQVDLPWVTPHLLAARSKGAYNRGRYQLEHMRLFVTSGLGLEDWPIRLGVPPTIDVLSL